MGYLRSDIVRIGSTMNYAKDRSGEYILINTFQKRTFTCTYIYNSKVYSTAIDKVLYKLASKYRHRIKLFSNEYNRKYIIHILTKVDSFGINKSSTFNET